MGLTQEARCHGVQDSSSPQRGLGRGRCPGQDSRAQALFPPRPPASLITASQGKSAIFLGIFWQLVDTGFYQKVVCGCQEGSGSRPLGLQASGRTGTHSSPSFQQSNSWPASLLLQGFHECFLCCRQNRYKQGLLPLKQQKKPQKFPEKVQENIDSIGLELSVGLLRVQLILSSNHFPACSVLAQLAAKS